MFSKEEVKVLKMNNSIVKGLRLYEFYVFGPRFGKNYHWVKFESDGRLAASTLVSTHLDRRDFST